MNTPEQQAVYRAMRQWMLVEHRELPVGVLPMAAWGWRKELSEDE